MKRVYVILRQYSDDYEEHDPEPWDVVSTMTRAQEICTLEEARSNQYHDGYYYYWTEVISSED